jgi:hypothetical protein
VAQSPRVVWVRHRQYFPRRDLEGTSKDDGLLMGYVRLQRPGQCQCGVSGTCPCVKRAAHAQIKLSHKAQPPPLITIDFNHSMVCSPNIPLSHSLPRIHIVSPVPIPSIPLDRAFSSTRNGQLLHDVKELYYTRYDSLPLILTPPPSLEPMRILLLMCGSWSAIRGFTRI